MDAATKERLLDQPKAWRDEDEGRAGWHSSRSTRYRALYRIGEERREVVVVPVDHSNEVYQPH